MTEYCFIKIYLHRMYHENLHFPGPNRNRPVCSAGVSTRLCLGPGSGSWSGAVFVLALSGGDLACLNHEFLRGAGEGRHCFCLALATAYQVMVLLGAWFAATWYQGRQNWAILAKIPKVLGWMRLLANVDVLVVILGYL